MKFFSSFLKATMISLIFSGGAVFASDFSIGALGGVAVLNNGGGSPFAYGGEVQYLVCPNFYVGLEFTNLNPNSITLGTNSYSSGLSNLDASFNYTVDGVNVGALVGYNSYSTNVPAASGGSYLNYGLTLGYDFMIGSSLSVGPQVDVLWTTQSSGFQETNFLAAFKYKL